MTSHIYGRYAIAIL